VLGEGRAADLARMENLIEQKPDQRYQG